MVAMAAGVQALLAKYETVEEVVVVEEEEEESVGPSALPAPDI